MFRWGVLGVAASLVILGIECLYVDEFVWRGNEANPNIERTSSFLSDDYANVAYDEVNSWSPTDAAPSLFIGAGVLVGLYANTIPARMNTK